MDEMVVIYHLATSWPRIPKTQIKYPIRMFKGASDPHTSNRPSKSILESHTKLIREGADCSFVASFTWFGPLPSWLSNGS